MVFGNKPGKKAKSLLISDRRKLSLLNVDFKLMTGIEAARMRKTMCRTVSPLQLVTGGDKRISHGVAMARDAIHAAGISQERCGMLDTDLIAAFDNMVSTWCLQVMSRKGLDNEVIARYRNLYDDNISIIVVNGIQGRKIKNVRQSVRQGDKFSMEIFAFGMDPILSYLECQIKGILINTQVAQGPMTQTAPHLSPRPEPPPALPGLPELPPQPPEAQPPWRHWRRILYIETRYVLYAYCDDLKPAITSRWEFRLVERVMTIFKLASGCKMHRSAES